MQLAPSLCLCLSGANYVECCLPLHQQPQDITWRTDDRLMRARFSALRMGNIDFLMNTTLASQQNVLNREALRAWADTTVWHSLTVQHVLQRSPKHIQVIFAAEYNHKDTPAIHIHKERALFVLTPQQGLKFVHPSVSKYASNASCICGNPLKYKKCCGAYLSTHIG